jgi:hypothetical protein
MMRSWKVVTSWSIPSSSQPIELARYGTAWRYRRARRRTRRGAERAKFSGHQHYCDLHDEV